MREALYTIEDVSSATGLEESKIRYLEKEFGHLFQFTEISPIKKYFNLQQLTLLQRISHLWQEEGLSLDAIKFRLHTLQSDSRKKVWTLAVTSGKGGVGKTSVVTNLSIALAGRGLKTVVLDADLGMANAHVLMGVQPQHTLHDLLQREVGIDDIIIDGPGGVRLIPGGSGVFDLADLTDLQRNFIIAEIQKISDYADVLIIDTAAGISANVTRFLSLADDVIVTASPSIVSLLDAYGVIKTMFSEDIRTPVSLLVNMARSAVQAKEVHGKIDQCSQQFLGWSIDYLGYIKKDLNVDRAIQMRSPLAYSYPHSPASRNIQKVADRLVEKSRQKKQKHKSENFLEIFCKGGKESWSYST